MGYAFGRRPQAANWLRLSVKVVKMRYFLVNEPEAILGAHAQTGTRKDKRQAKPIRASVYAVQRWIVMSKGFLQSVVTKTYSLIDTDRDIRNSAFGGCTHQ